ncbi:MAG TPA: hypothetical protein DCP02_06570 [Actinobacteria bacterium]|nr:hypothetical protein [Actinomycetota bacterium]
MIATYNTSANIEEKPAEVHRKYIDLQYILYGEEKIGYADYRNPKISLKEYLSHRYSFFYPSTRSSQANTLLICHKDTLLYFSTSVG